MEIHGRVHNGVVVFDGDVSLPEGADVSVLYPTPIGSESVVEKRRICVPLVRSDHPGSVNLTGERIAQILDDENASP